MAKNDNIQDLLIDVADAIRAKKGTTDKINPLNFSAEIRNLSGQESTIEVRGVGNRKSVQFTGAWYTNCVYKAVRDDEIINPNPVLDYNLYVKCYGASYIDKTIYFNRSNENELRLTNVNRVCTYALSEMNLTALYLHNINHIDAYTFRGLSELFFVLITGNNPYISDDAFLDIRSSGNLLVDELNFKNKKLLSKFVGWNLYVFTPDGKNLNYKGRIIQGHAIY